MYLGTYTNYLLVLGCNKLSFLLLDLQLKNELELFLRTLVKVRMKVGGGS